MDAEPTLADDEAHLAVIAADFGAALSRQVPVWLRRRTLALAPSVEHAVLDQAVDATMAALGPELERILAADVDAGAGSPLAAVRASVGEVTAVLVAAGVDRPERDEFGARVFPDDIYGLGPASFAEIDESLHEPSLVWGAARAHVHLRRRRELDR